MGVLEEIRDELKRLNKNIQVTNTELSTVDPTVIQEKVKEPPMEKVEEPKQETTEEVKTTEDDKATQEFTKDYVLSVGKEFVKNADDADKKAFKDKLTELNATKLSTLDEQHFPTIVSFMKARMEA
ncbi:hypothetical protein BUZ62_00850 [Staphylococcus pasteuri]|uniref:hypothetical protein n=1 Tax=Staphylococcus pasteuri TaxID=45972 RepID=UPI000D39C9F9|nr:hypothetical protein [Staphylococcus pasteuri]MEB7433312.1 hypothetical protein [Staphylococcus pasteuri]PTU88096.1 hypothetical protein BUZ62_00850 [Staphylococcus pasteuri]